MADTTLNSRSRWLTLARIITAGFMVFCITLFVAAMLHYQDFASQHPESFTAWGWSIPEMDSVLRQVGLSFDWWIQWSLISMIIFAGMNCGISIFLLLRKHNDGFVLYLAAAFTMFGTLGGYSPAIAADMLPTLEPLLKTLGVIPWVSIFMVFYLFPNGRFIPSWSRWAAGLLILEFVIDIIFFAGDSPPPFLMVPMMLSLAIAPISQVYRYLKVSNEVERQQTKWVMLAMVVVMLILFTGLFPMIFPGMRDPSSPVAPILILLTSLYTVIMGLIPISISFAILRYRLWDVDVLIRKTLMYALLSGMLGLIYFGTVALLQRTLVTERGKPSPIVIVATTLAIAALFNPLRRRLQESIDRRFYRQKYDSEKALENFATVARSETDLARLASNLTGTIQETMQPSWSSLWLQNTGNVKASNEG